MTITAKALIEKVRELAIENPTNVYIGKCMYASGSCTNGTIGCIFGQALKALGCTTDDLYGFDSWNDSSIDYVLNSLDKKASNIEKNWCQLVQMKQDTGYRWKTAIELADHDLAS